MQLQKAQSIANNLVNILSLYCEPGRCHIAGSVRRQKPEVKDIEIVCQPLVEEYKDLFGAVQDSIRNKDFVYSVDILGKAIKGSALHGRYKQIALPQGINLDLFMPDPADYFRQLTIRTGSAEYVKVEIAKAWRKKGWCGSDKGFRKMEDCIEHIGPDGKISWTCANPNPELPPVWESEKAFFEWLGVHWIDPALRNV